jgi:hypothetical protein
MGMVGGRSQEPQDENSWSVCRGTGADKQESLRATCGGDDKTTSALELLSVRYHKTIVFLTNHNNHDITINPKTLHSLKSSSDFIKLANNCPTVMTGLRLRLSYCL